jgi:hypothetical protein
MATELKAYRLKVGLHEGPDQEWKPDPKVEGRQRRPSKKYDAKDRKRNIVLSATNLAERWPEKFEVVYAQEATTIPQEAQAPTRKDETKASRGPMPKLETMNVTQLRKLGEDEELELPAEATREQLIATIKKAW